MKSSVVLALLIVASTGYAASAAPFDSSGYADIDVVSVTPRSAYVKPYVMAIFTKDQQQRVAALKKEALAASSQHR